MTEKIIGYSLLAIGILIIVFSALNIVFVFTGKALPVQLFNFPAISLDMGQSLGLPKAVGVQPTELISANILNQTSNLFIHLFLMGFLVSVGQKLASLGVELLRPVIIKIKGREDIPAE